MNKILDFLIYCFFNPLVPSEFKGNSGIIDYKFETFPRKSFSYFFWVKEKFGQILLLSKISHDKYQIQFKWQLWPQKSLNFNYFKQSLIFILLSAQRGGSEIRRNRKILKNFIINYRSPSKK